MCVPEGGVQETWVLVWCWETVSLSRRCWVMGTTQEGMKLSGGLLWKPELKHQVSIDLEVITPCSRTEAFI